MRILTFSSLYPSAAMPQHGIFVEWRLRKLVADGTVESRVVSPVPWFPRPLERICARYAPIARVAPFEERYGIPVEHPRYPHVPKIGMNFQARAMAMGAAPTISKLLAAGYDFDLLDAHYFYPDGVAASLLAKHFDKPFVVTARGSDINAVAQYPEPKRLILSAAERAAGIVAVSAALKDALVALGVPVGKIAVIRNGVDLALFKPGDRTVARRRLGFSSRLRLLSVGNLVANKGHHLVIAAMKLLPEWELVLVGDGAQRESLRRLARSCGVADRVCFAGRVSQEDLPHFYNAADALVLASSREGLPNVLLESIACGTPVVATSVGGVPEIVSCEAAGLLIDRRDSATIATALKALLANYPDRKRTRKHAEAFSWDVVAEAQRNLFASILDKGGMARRDQSLSSR